ncbi:MAG: aminotransferase class V-fold PLP-dependent enzyme [Candidatus Marinimicrobia bacterium]|nr:aminotransferase class V-fold PLP-dependent enzyme [Candidatus Neomarinimicrobiota bacterium]
MKELRGSDLLSKVHSDFIGLDTKYPLATGKISRRIYLDSTASTLMMGAAFRTAEEFLHHYANTHSEMHFSARIATKTYDWVHQRILSFVGANPEEYACFFVGSGATGGINRMARVFRDFNPNKEIVIVSIMEHHSNDLPHRKHGGKVIHISAEDHDGKLGCINLRGLEENLKKYRNQVNYIAVTGVSNVTGIINPINEVTKLAHRYGAYLLVDGAQMAAHVPIQMGGHADAELDIDALVFSGHKTYVPGSPGVVIARKNLLKDIEPEEVGGGMVGRVYENRYIVKDKFPDREEAGTPNIFGAVALGAAVEILDRIGMDFLLEEETKIINNVLEKMLEIPGINIYGDTDFSACPRAASISFNIRGMDHGLIAALLNDYFNIAVRNECFCAHPYVEKMLDSTHHEKIINVDQLSDKFSIEPWMGMVRASFGIYNTREDGDALIDALNKIIKNKRQLSEKYFVDHAGEYRHRTFQPECENYFSIVKTLGEMLKNRR